MRQPRSRHVLTPMPAFPCAALPAAVLLQSSKWMGLVLLACAASACGSDANDEGWHDPHLTTGANSTGEPADSSGTEITSTIPVEPAMSPGPGTTPSNQSPTTMDSVMPQAPPADSSDQEPPPGPGGQFPNSGPDTPTGDMQPPPMPEPVSPPVNMTPGGSTDTDAGTALPEPVPQDADAGTAGEPDVDDVTSMSGEEVPMTDHCAAVAEWDPMWTQWEDEVLLLVNEYRAMGFNCDSEGSFEATTPLTTDPLLRCAARLHSLDMYERGYFAHDNPDGVDPFERMAAAGFSGSYMGENIAQGQSSPEDVMRAWMESDGHCSNVMNPNYTLIGIGFHPGSDSDRRAQRYWTQNFGAPPRQGGGGRR